MLELQGHYPPNHPVMTHWERWERNTPHFLFPPVSLPLFPSPFDLAAVNQHARDPSHHFELRVSLCAKLDELKTLFWRSRFPAVCERACVRKCALKSVCDESRGKVVVTCGMLGGQQRDSMSQGSTTHRHTHTHERSGQPVTAVAAFSTS